MSDSLIYYIIFFIVVYIDKKGIVLYKENFEVILIFFLDEDFEGFIFFYNCYIKRRYIKMRFYVRVL